MRPAIPSLIGSRFLSCVFGTRCSANGANSFAVRRLLPLAAGLMFNAIGAAYADGGKISDRAPSEISAAITGSASAAFSRNARLK
jgi:hypothetical protein